MMADLIEDVYAMFLDENYLDSKKTLTFEPVVIVTSSQSQICDPLTQST